MPKTSSSDASNEFLYLQVAEQLEKDIRSGTLPLGSRLPSLDKLAKSYNMNRLTVFRAMTRLKRDGLVYAIPGQGTYVADVLPDNSGETNGRKRNVTIGLVSEVMIEGSVGAYHADIISGMQRTVAKASMHLTLIPAAQIQREQDMTELLNGTVDGFIFVGPFPPRVLDRILRYNPPVVLCDYVYDGQPIDSVCVDNRHGGECIARHIIGLGHRRISVICGDESQPAEIQRMEGIRSVIRSEGGGDAVLHEVPGDFTRESGAEGIRTVLKDYPDTTAVICMNDDTAAGALQVIHAETELDVPGDLSITGFDNINIAYSTHPPLTTMHIDRHGMGRMAVQRLIERLEHPDTAPATIMIQTSLVERGSTATPSPAPSAVTTA